MRPINRCFFIGILLLLSFDLFAQTAEENPGYFFIGFSTGLSIDQWNLSNKLPLGDGITASSKGQMGYVASVNAGYSFNPHWNLSIAPGVTGRKLEYRLDHLHFDVDYNGTGFNDSHAIFITKATSLTLPVTVQYIFGTKKILPFVSLGGAVEFVLHQSTDATVYYSTGDTEPVSGVLLKKNNVTAIAAAGIQCKIGSKVLFSISPVFSYSLIEDFEGGNSFYYGAVAGLFYKIGNP